MSLVIAHPVIDAFFQKYPSRDPVRTVVQCIEFLDTHLRAADIDIENKLSILFEGKFLEIKQTIESGIEVSKNTNNNLANKLTDITNLHIEHNNLATDRLNKISQIVDSVDNSSFELKLNGVENKLSDLINKTIDTKVAVDTFKTVINNDITSQTKTVCNEIKINSDRQCERLTITADGVKNRCDKITNDVRSHIQTDTNSMSHTICSAVENKFEKQNMSARNMIGDEYEKFHKKFDDFKSEVVETMNRGNQANLDQLNGVFKTTNSHKLGEQSEDWLINLLGEGNVNVVSTRHEAGQCDLQIQNRGIGKPIIVIENKNYTANVPSNEVEKFVGDISKLGKAVCGIFISQRSGIAKKPMIAQLELMDNSIPVMYLSHVNYNKDMILTAIAALDALYERVTLEKTRYTDDSVDENPEFDYVQKAKLAAINEEVSTLLKNKINLITIHAELSEKLNALRGSINEINFDRTIGLLVEKDYRPQIPTPEAVVKLKGQRAKKRKNSGD